MPPVENVIDLTCEFSESKSIVENTNYISFPILDASVVSVSELSSLIETIDSLSGRSYIHCAQGHGRTGMVAAALLMHRNPTITADSAIGTLQAVRPDLRCNSDQLAILTEIAR